MTQVFDCPPRSFQIRADAAANPLKARQQAMWASGDFAVIGTTLQSVGEDLCEAAELRSGSRVLDVACGNGNATLAAARRFCEVTGIDYVPALLSRAAERARAERLEITLLDADAENLPFAAGSFDHVISSFGVMFTADQAQAACELVRVCKPGGTIALANWTPEGFLGELLRTVSRHVPPAPGAPSALRWGTPRGIAELFSDQAAVVHMQRKQFVFRYRSAEHMVETFRYFYGPTYKAFEALDEAGQAALHADLLRLVTARSRDPRGTAAVPGEYLEIVLETANHGGV